VKPLDISQILPAIETALSRAAEMRVLREKEEQLSTALAGHGRSASPSAF
jgi:AmiR/NasT family two-component response regulator